MNTASLDLSKELYDLLGWDSNDISHLFDNLRADDTKDDAGYVPLYTLGYLMRKLPQSIILDDGRNGQLSMAHDNPDNIPECWLFRYHTTGFYGRADTPEDALCKLAIELAKAGIIGKPDTLEGDSKS